MGPEPWRTALLRRLVRRLDGRIAVVSGRTLEEVDRILEGAVTPVAKGDQKVWLPSNFKITIDGLDCTKVRTVDSLTVKQPAIKDDIGITREPQKQAQGRLEFPNLTITLAESSAESWFAWFEDFVIKGNNGDSNEKTGSIDLFAIKKVVEAVENPAIELTLQEAKRIDPAAELEAEVRIPKSTDLLGRISAQTAKQVIFQKVREASIEKACYNNRRLLGAALDQYSLEHGKPPQSLSDVVGADKYVKTMPICPSSVHIG